MKLTITPDLAKRVLTVDEALSLLETFTDNRKKRLHTFDISFGLMGCDMDLTEVKKRLKACNDGEIMLAKGYMFRMNHAVAFYQENRGWLYLATNSKKMEQLCANRQLNLN